MFHDSGRDSGSCLRPPGALRPPLASAARCASTSTAALWLLVRQILAGIACLLIITDMVSFSLALPVLSTDEIDKLLLVDDRVRPRLALLHVPSLINRDHLTADHYGSAEQLYVRPRSPLSRDTRTHTHPQGNFRSSLPADLGEHVVGATKWCIFKAPLEPIDRQFVLAAVRERAKRMRVDAATKSKECARVDFLQASWLFSYCSGDLKPAVQFHWQDYADKRYIQTLHILASLRHPATQLAYPTSTLHTSSAKRLSTSTTSTSPSSVSTLTSSLRAATLQQESKPDNGRLTISTKIDCYPSPSSSYDSSPSSSFGGTLSPAKLALFEHEAAEKLAVHQQQQDGVRVGGIGLVNFDSIRVDEICASLGPGVILTNQVQVRVAD